MANLDELDLSERLFLKGYPFKRYAPRAGEPLAMTPLRKPLAAAMVALVTSAGLSLPDQLPFDSGMKMGDPSFREFPATISPQLLEVHQRSWSFDKTGLLRDRNLALPLDRLREMRASGEIGALAPRHFSFMGSLVSPRKLIADSAPEVARRLRDDGVDVVLLTPV